MWPHLIHAFLHHVETMRNVRPSMGNLHAVACQGMKEDHQIVDPNVSLIKTVLPIELAFRQNVKILVREPVVIKQSAV